MYLHLFILTFSDDEGHVENRECIHDCLDNSVLHNSTDHRSNITSVSTPSLLKSTNNSAVRITNETATFEKGTIDEERQGEQKGDNNNILQSHVKTKTNFQARI